MFHFYGDNKIQTSFFSRLLEFTFLFGLRFHRHDIENNNCGLKCSERLVDLIKNGRYPQKWFWLFLVGPQ